MLMLISIYVVIGPMDVRGEGGCVHGRREGAVSPPGFTRRSPGVCNLSVIFRLTVCAAAGTRGQVAQRWQSF